ncbi:hypothetical protein BZA70DRAFT_268825 [Myxozyma melibiosi]|uniref:DUF4484 domain-containing protein n=1 Tax=Myxozyma melibiosi TaxID=54550 RepID=A0ABR1F234_9ASCO
MPTPAESLATVPEASASAASASAAAAPPTAAASAEAGDSAGSNSRPLRDGAAQAPLPNTPPPIVALFLIRFDTRRGYVIDWSRTSSPAITLDSIEYKAFPSGLHHFKSDVIYFMHGEYYSGVSVFLRIDTDNAAERFARMYSLGVLVPSGLVKRGKSTAGAGRLGRSWGHVDGLKQLLDDYSRNAEDFQPLEAYFKEFGLSASDSASTSASSTSASETAIYNPPRRPFELNSSKIKFQPSQLQQTQPQPQQQPSTIASSDNDTFSQSFSGAAPILPKSHPAHSLPSFLDTFGPLVFKIWKAALARERILIVGDIPLEQGCNFVYDIAILANIPQAISEMLPIPAYRIRPLFSVGLNDIDYLRSLSNLTPAEGARQRKPRPFYGWIAYTTDKLLQEKKDLYDVVVKLPPMAASISAAASAAISTSSRPASPHSLNAYSAVYHPVTETIQEKIRYPAIYYESNPKERLKASIRDMRRFQSLEAQIGNSIDPRHRWYQRFYQDLEVAEEEAEYVNLERRVSLSSSSTDEFSAHTDRRRRRPPSSETMALLAASENITAAASEDEIYNDDPELFFSTKTDLATEQPSWKQLTWLGFLWWASAGEEARIDEEEVAETNARGLVNNETTTSLDRQAAHIERGTRPLLLDDSISRSSSVATTPMALSNEESFTYISPFQDISQLDEAFMRRMSATKQDRRRSSVSDDEEVEGAAMIAAAIESSKQVSIIAFFHRFTARIFSELSRMVQEQNLVIQKLEPAARRRRSASTAAQAPSVMEAKQTLWISKVDMLAMGLDPWSESDSRFVSTIVERWWGGQIESRRDNEFLNSITFCC